MYSSQRGRRACVRYIEWLYYYYFFLSLSLFRRPRQTPLLANPDFIFATLRLKQLHTHTHTYKRTRATTKKNNNTH
jgi:hypothetical protein